MHTHTHTHTHTVAGVLYTHIHGAKNLTGYHCCDPYCTVAVTTNTKKNSTLLCTRSITGSPNPIWEQGMELFVADYTTVSDATLIYD